MPRILIIDEDEAVQRTVKPLLEWRGFEVHVASDGQEGLSATGNQSFDLAVVDIFMPGMDGIKTVRQFSERVPSMPIIATSGFMFRNSTHDAPDFLAIAAKLGAAFGIRKPFRLAELLHAIETCLQERHWQAG